MTMTNSMIGDSYKKVRYSDFIYMCRMQKDMDVFDDAVKKHVVGPEHMTGPDQINESILRMKDKICENLIPFEVKITKSKDAGRDESTFALFCKQNLRIYNNLGEYISDITVLERLSQSLDTDINTLTDLTMSFNNEAFEDDTFDNIVPFANQ